VKLWRLSYATESDLNLVETISIDTSLQDRDAHFDTLNHSLNDETEVYLQNTEILPNLELESKMHIDSNVCSVFNVCCVLSCWF
jgi:hypothetical protein